MPTHIELAAKDYGLNKDSVILLEQIRTIDKRRLEKIGRIDDGLMASVNNALSISFGLGGFKNLLIIEIWEVLIWIEK